MSNAKILLSNCNRASNNFASEPLIKIMDRNFYNITKICLALFILMGNSCKKSLDDTSSNTSQTKCIPNNLPDQFKAVFVSEQIPNQVEPSPIAIFQFSQGMKTYSNTNCKNLPNTCSTSLKIQNISGRRMKIAYTIEYLQGNNFWTSDGYADILKDSSFNTGIVSTNCGWITTDGLKVIKKSAIFE